MNFIKKFQLKRWRWRNKERRMEVVKRKCRKIYFKSCTKFLERPMQLSIQILSLNLLLLFINRKLSIFRIKLMQRNRSFNRKSKLITRLSRRLMIFANLFSLSWIRRLHLKYQLTEYGNCTTLSFILIMRIGALFAAQLLRMLMLARQINHFPNLLNLRNVGRILFQFQIKSSAVKTVHLQQICLRRRCFCIM